MSYRPCGRSGLRLPALSLGLWQNFGDGRSHESCRNLVLRGFDLGITHFDLANNYGPPPGASEQVFGRILREDLSTWRDEIVIATKAGYETWPGPYGNGGSRKYLIASADQSLRRIGADYLDIFYHHRPDPETPLEETMEALDYIVRSGRALYVGVSNYTADQTARASAILRALGTPCLVHQPRYNMFERDVEAGLAATLKEHGIGGVVFCPLAQGLLTGRYIEGIPSDSRAGQGAQFLKPDQITPEKIARIRRLTKLARRRGQSLAQMALMWVLRDPVITSAVIGASRVAQLEENVAALQKPSLSPEELAEIETILTESVSAA